MFFFFLKQKTAYEMRISDWSSDVCSSDLLIAAANAQHGAASSMMGQNVDVPALIAQERHVGDRGFRAGQHDHCRPRSEERRVRKECVSTCRSRWSPYT